MDSQQRGIQEDAIERWYNEEDNDDTSNTINSSINADNIETEGTSTVSIVVRTCDTDVSHQKMRRELNIWICNGIFGPPVHKFQKYLDLPRNILSPNIMQIYRLIIKCN